MCIILFFESTLPHWLLNELKFDTYSKNIFKLLEIKHLQVERQFRPTDIGCVCLKMTIWAASGRMGKREGWWQQK
jgi:hypothetical protein